MSHDLLAPLTGRDPSLPLALAALVRDAGPEGGLGFSDLVLGYREAFLVCHRSVFGGGDPELTGDQVRENLLASVLPRLADDGWIQPSAPAGWVGIQASGRLVVRSRHGSRRSPGPAPGVRSGRVPRQRVHRGRSMPRRPPH